MINLKLIFLPVVFCVLAACGESAMPDASQSQRQSIPKSGRVSVHELKSAVADGDERRLIVLLNELKKVNPTREEIEYIYQLWLDDELGGFNDPNVRLEVANVLVQSVNNGRLKISKSEFGNYARRFIRSEDDALARRAILVLGLVGGDDVFDLIDVALNEREETFYAASIALALMCGFSDAERVGFLKKIKSKKLANEFQKIWSSYSTYREGFCK